MNNKIKIVDILERNKKGVHLRELARLLKTGLNNVQRHTKLLEKEGVIKKQEIGNLTELFLNESPKTEAYLKQVHTERFFALPIKVQRAIQDFINELETPPLLEVVFGSYARGNYKLSSDIDILLVFQETKKEDEIDNIAKRISMRTNTKISLVYVNYSNFKINFLNKEHEFSKELKKEVIILQGVEIYYKLLWRFLK